jgi:phospholipase/lecithinase/hemolysin
MRTIGPARRPSVLSILMICFAFVAGAADVRAGQTEFDQVVVFGDSLSDSGNTFALLGTAGTPPDYLLNPFLIPAAPYARGGHHLSNGATWIEQFARPLGLAGSVRPAFQGSDPFATNYAVGAARARNEGPFNLAVQVGAFLQQFGGNAPSDALYVIQIGSNDVRDALLAGGPLQAAAILDAARLSISDSIKALYAAGARTFLVWNSPDIGLTPAVRILDTQIPGTAAAASTLTQMFNAALAAELTLLSGLPGIDIVPFDAFALVSAIVATPGDFGLTNVTDACVTPNVPPFACQPADYLFWDGIHPTEAVHAIIAREVALLLGQ